MIDWSDAELLAKKLVRAERLRQVAKWGNQSHSDGEWSIILAEEVGEWAKESFDGNDPTNKLAENVQIAAVALAMVVDELRKQS